MTATSHTCTSAFGVKLPNGTTGILTAAHCVKSSPSSTLVPNTNIGLTISYNSMAIVTIQNAMWDATRDFAWGSGSGHIGVNKLWDGTAYRRITSSFTGQVKEGKQLCKFGTKTRYTCQEVIRNDFKGVDSTGVKFGPLVQLGGTQANIAQCGDSGGPIFAGSTAYGVMSRGDVDGICSGGSSFLYAPLSGLSSLGVSVLTS